MSDYDELVELRGALLRAEVVIDQMTESTELRLIADSLPGERRALAEACYQIAADVSLYCVGCGGKLEPQGPFAAVHPGTWHPHCARQRTADER